MLQLLTTPSTINLRSPFSTDNILLIRSTFVDLKAGGRASINLINDAGDYVLHIGFRPDTNQIVFNTRRGSNWEAQQEVPFRARLGRSGEGAMITICDLNDRFQIIIDNYTLFYFTKRFPSAATSLQYIAEGESNSPPSLFDTTLVVDSYASLANLLPHAGN